MSQNLCSQIGMFFGIKLDRGQHFVWMEYQPWLPTVGLLVALLGWFFTFAQIMVHRESFLNLSSSK